MLKKEYFSMEMKIADDKLSSLISSMAILRFLYTQWTRNNVKWKYAGACLFDVKTRMSVSFFFSLLFLSVSSDFPSIRSNSRFAVDSNITQPSTENQSKMWKCA